MSSDINPTARQIHQAEEIWAQASGILDEMLVKIVHDTAELKKLTGLSDASILFDYICTTLAMTHPHVRALTRTEITCAAALTRLAQASRGETYDMTQFEKEIGDDEH